MRKTISLLRERHQNDERGSSVMILVLIMMPVIIGMFGLAVDVALGHHVKQMMQGNLQSAAVSGSSQLNLNTKNINTSRARTVAIEQYNLNRSAYVKNIRCAKSSDLKPGESLHGPTSCRWILVGFERDPGNKRQIRMTVRENVKTVWSGIVGLNEFNVTVGTEASSVNN